MQSTGMREDLHDFVPELTRCLRQDAGFRDRGSLEAKARGASDLGRGSVPLSVPGYDLADLGE